MILSVISLIIKNLPLILGILKGITNGLNRVAPSKEGVAFDQDALSEVIEKIAEREVLRIVEENSRDIIIRVPDEETRQRQETLDEMERRLREAQEEFEREMREKERRSTPAPSSRPGEQRLEP